MKRRPDTSASRAFTLVETMMGAAAASIVAIGVFMVLNTGMLLSAKNLALNMTSTAMRTSLDRVEQLLQQADTMPVLIDTAGAASASPAAGVSFDRYIGGPYVITAPVGGLPDTATSLTLTRTTNIVSAPPIPTVGDVVRIDGTALTLRPLLTATTVGIVDGAQHQAIVGTLAAQLGTPVTLVSSTIMTAKLVRKAALIAAANGGMRQLRYYPSYETTTNLNDATKYSVVVDQIAMQNGDETPFTLVNIQGKSFVSLSVRVRASQFDRRLIGKQADQFNTFARVDCYIRPKINP